MTDRVNAFVVVLDQTIRKDDAEDVIKLLKTIRGVSSVRPVPEDITTVIARDRARTEIRSRIMDVLDDRT